MKPRVICALFMLVTLDACRPGVLRVSPCPLPPPPALPGSPLIETEAERVERWNALVFAVAAGEVRRYWSAYQRYPQSLDAVLELPPPASTPRITKDYLLDAWSRPVRLRAEDDEVRFRLESDGPDGRAATEDDVSRDYELCRRL